MGRSEGLSPREPQPPSRKLFPVGEQSISRVHRLMTSVSFDDLINFEATFIKDHNPEFHILLRGICGAYQENAQPAVRGGFMDGARYTHLLLRDPKNNQIPTFIKDEERNDADTIYLQELHAMRTFAENNDINESNFEQIAEARIKGLTDRKTGDDKLFADEIIDISFGHPDGPAFLVGAMAAYFSIKSLWEMNSTRDESERKQTLRAVEALPQEEREIDRETLAAMGDIFPDIEETDIDGNKLADEIYLFFGNGNQQDAA